jgi:hypothetical protein
MPVNDPHNLANPEGPANLGCTPTPSFSLTGGTPFLASGSAWVSVPGDYRVHAYRPALWIVMAS